MNKEFCNNHDCIVNEIEHLKEDNKEMKKAVEQVRDEIRALSTHEKIFVAFIGFMGVCLSAGGSMLGIFISQAWK